MGATPPGPGQKRCIALNAAEVAIRDSFIAECKTVGQDSQAIGGWNGPGPYVIENNYLEAAGENVLLGGSDPAIANLVADGVTFRRNYVSRPMAWRSPIIPTPGSVTAAAESGGGLAIDTYAYRIVARRSVGQGVTGRSTASSAVTTVVYAAGSSVRVRWIAVPGASEYRVYGRLTTGQTMYWNVTGTEFVDSGAPGTTEAVPTSAGTVWLVKNLFELKNARNVVVEHNVFENHWRDAQAGYAIVITPRNSGNTCTWCVVENVRFESNLIRNVAAGFNILGYDSPEITRQTRNVTIANNLVYDVIKSLGGNGWFALIGDEPRDVVIDHNTIEHEGSTLVSVYGGTATAPRIVQGFRMTNNAAQHGSYGMGGAFFTYGNGILAGFYPGSVFTNNYLAGGSAARYPAGNLFAGLLQDQFVNAGVADFTLRGDSLLRGQGTDGLDVGADVKGLTEALAGVVEGVSPAPMQPPIAAFTAKCVDMTCTMTDASTDADGTPAAWSWTFGDGSTATTQNALHTFSAGGSYAITLVVTDNSGMTATDTRSVTVIALNVLPTAAISATCVGLSCTFTCASIDADGAITSRRWRFPDGTTGSSSTEAHKFQATGTYSVILDVTDDRDGTASTQITVAVVALVHVGELTGTLTTWKTYWSTAMEITVHDEDENPVAGATVAVQWTEAVVKTGSCVTNAVGICTVLSGTLSRKRPSVTLTVTDVTAPSATYSVSMNHSTTGTGSSITLTR